ncbi:hypothetical protein [Niveispirillum sp. KHB5.9]|uniref:hypothetical protein n=1 Tax=Niveispirillum sp. KHB5.9 TaxID=3400269 RepID=UPI003A86BCCB
MTNILATCCDTAFFDSCLTLVASVQETSGQTVDRILVYDLGLEVEQAEYLDRCRQVEVVQFPQWVGRIFPGYLFPGQYAWKPFVIKDAARHGDRVLYMDSGAMALKDLKTIYDRIAQNDIFLVGDSHLNRDWTHEMCFRIMDATEDERNGRQIWAGLQGYKPGGRYQRYIDDAFTFSCIKSAVFGDRASHRHDQSLYSVLAQRYGAPREDIHIFGEWRGFMSPDQVILVHRRGYRPADRVLRMRE